MSHVALPFYAYVIYSILKFSFQKFLLAITNEIGLFVALNSCYYVA